MVSQAVMRRLAGPGLIFTGAAIGTSHLVQSTRAGALYGLALVGVILLANLVKYPAYRFGVDFAQARGQSLLTGYRELGRWAVWLFLIAVIPLVPIVYAALGAATAGILAALVGPLLPLPAMATLVIAAASLLLLVGGYRLLDRVNGVLLAFLVASTLLTTALVLPRVDWATLTDLGWTGEIKALLFIVALAGFMPNPMDVSVALSLWKVEADRSLPDDTQPTLEQSRRSFLWPYVVTALMAVCFCIMGAGTLHADGIAPLPDAPGFAGQLVGLYRGALGEIAAALAAVAALSVMLTTVIAAIDAYARVVPAALAVLRGAADERGTRGQYVGTCLVLAAMAILVLFTLMGEFTAFLDFTTSATFLVAPVLALLNYLVVTRCALAEEARPGPAMRALALAGIAVMAALALLYFVLV